MMSEIDGKPAYIFAFGDEKERTVKGIREVLTPAGYIAEHKIGIVLLDVHGRGYDVFKDRDDRGLMSTYRGMQIANLIRNFSCHPADLFSCLVVGKRGQDGPVPEHYARALKRVEALIGADERARILEMVPDNLEEVILTCETNGFVIDPNEIYEEVQRGRIRPPYSKALIRTIDRALDNPVAQKST